jgi:hypothetical protein
VSRVGPHAGFYARVDIRSTSYLLLVPHSVRGDVIGTEGMIYWTWQMVGLLGKADALA